MIAKLVGQQVLGIDLLVPIVPMDIEHAAVIHRVLNPDASVLKTLPLSCSLEVRITAKASEYDQIVRAMHLLLPV